MGSTMLTEVLNDGKGPAVRVSHEAERAIVDAAVCAAGFGGEEVAADGVPGYTSGPVLAVSLADRSGCELTLATALRVRHAVLNAAAWQRQQWQRARRDDDDDDDDDDDAPPPPCCPVVVVTGTDALEELALALDWLLPRRQEMMAVACVVTGAMRTASALCPDGPANLADALVAASAAAAVPRSGGRPAVLVAMGGQLHAALHVRKVCSQGPAFSSGPCAGPVGTVSAAGASSAVVWSCGGGGGPPAPSRLPTMLMVQRQRAQEDDEQEDDLDVMLLAMDASKDLRTRVVIWTLTADAMPPPDALLDCCDGLLLSCPGTGSVPRSVLEVLAPAARARGLPVAICSRCGSGPNHDVGLYGERSVAQYEEAGFLVFRRRKTTQGEDEEDDDGGQFCRLAPVQARLALSVALSLAALSKRWEAGDREERTGGDRANVM